MSAFADEDPRILVFYADQLLEEWDLPLFWRNKFEVPDGAYLLVPDGMRMSIGKPGWYRKDLTPVLDADVPPTLKALVLLLT